MDQITLIPPQWDIKPHTQMFGNEVSSMNWKVAKIDRRLNTTAHSLDTHQLLSAPNRHYMFKY